MKRADVIEKRGNLYVVLSKEGKELGEFESREAAAERLRQIEATKAAQDDGGVVEILARDAKFRAKMAEIDAMPSPEQRLKEREAAKAARGDSVRRIDYLGPIHMDPDREDGFLARIDEHNPDFLRVDARLTRTGVFEYADTDGNRWGELRTEDQVFDQSTLRSFELTTLTNDHPADFVSAANVKDVQVGTVGTDVRRDGRFVRASIVITDANVIQSIKDGKIELSCGYTADVIRDSGVTDDGTPFAARQTNIRGNHVALVSQGRAGSSCSLLVGRGDAFTTLTEIHPMKTRKIKVGDAEYEVPEDYADALEAEAKEKETPAETPEPEAVAEIPAETPSNDDADALRARVDALEADKKDEPTRIDARVNLVASAREVLGHDVQTTGVSDSALMTQIVLKVRPTLKAKLDAHQKSHGYLYASYEDALERHREGAANVRDTSTALFQAVVSDDEKTREDAELDDSISKFYLGAAAEGGN